MPSMFIAVAALSLFACALGNEEAGAAVSLTDGKTQEPAATSSRANALHLNAHTFAGNVLRKPLDEHAEHWVVSFCPNWWEPCQNLALPFDQFSIEWERKLNKELLTKKVRFATVDCATDKVLCNQQRVEQYPTVHHYWHGKRAGTFVGGRQSDVEKLAKFLTKRLGPAAAAAEPKPAEEPAAAEAAQKGLVERLAPGDRSIDLALIVAVLSLNTWAVFSNPRLWQQSPSATPEDASMKPAAVAASAGGAAAAGTEAAAASVRRFLPRDWSGPSASMEL